MICLVLPIHALCLSCTALLVSFKRHPHLMETDKAYSWRVRLAKQETLTPPGHLVSPLVCRGSGMSTVVLYCWFHSDSVSVLLYFTFLSHLFPLPCGAGSTVPRGVRLKCYYAFFLVCCGCGTSYIVSVHIQCQAFIYNLCCVAGIHGGCG